MKALLLAATLLGASAASAAPRDDFYATFSDNLVSVERTALLNAPHACSVDGNCGFQAGREWILSTQALAVSRAMEKTLDEHYPVKRWSRRYVQLPEDPAAAAGAAAVGAALLYVDGLRTHAKVLGWRLGLNLASGRRLQADRTARLASVELGPEGQALALSAGFGRQAPSFGFRYALKY